MELELHVRGTHFAETLRRYAERRFRFALRRFTHHVKRLRIDVEDVNGPRGGVDKQCRILADVAPSGKLVLREKDAHLYAAMDRAADRLKHSVCRDIQRRHARETGKAHAGSIRRPAALKLPRVEASLPAVGP
ncbi:MAG TPA: HPF/RaiA family ribosome-associated protein [Terriglobia bacterium]|nr:HPF/RaiA family ribosome-associated protein [Terriglobia bacterium]